MAPSGITIDGKSLENLSAQIEHSVLQGLHKTIPDTEAMELINVIFGLLEELERILGRPAYEQLMKELPDRW